MIYGCLKFPDQFAPMLGLGPWRQVFSILASLGPEAEPGRREVDGDRIFINVDEYRTKSASECRFEAHRRYVDVQVALSGSEFIDWLPIGMLNPAGDHDDNRDIRFFDHDPHTSTPVRMPLTAGWFIVLFPFDAHRPQIADVVARPIRKAVAKVDVAVLGAECS